MVKRSRPTFPLVGVKDNSIESGVFGLVGVSDIGGVTKNRFAMDLVELVFVPSEVKKNDSGSVSWSSAVIENVTFCIDSIEMKSSWFVQFVEVSKQIGVIFLFGIICELTFVKIGASSLGVNSKAIVWIADFGHGEEIPFPHTLLRN